MIVRDAGDNWQVVLQTDHADLSAAFARAWVDRGDRHDSLTLATERHDDGWSVWEASPRLDEHGKPISFLEVDVLSHLAFYRACIAAVTAEDPYAGLLVSMHGAGIYRQRYGTDPGLRLAHADEVREHVDAFVAEQESSHPERMAAAGVSEELRWADYGRLQLYDRLSLHFCMRDPAVATSSIGDFTISPGSAPGRVTVNPYPFEGEGTFSLLRRRIRKDGWGAEEFRSGFLALDPERVEFVLEPAQ